MARQLQCKMKDYIQPFERQLALMELEAVADSHPLPAANHLSTPGHYVVSTSREPEDLVGRLTYWECVASAHESAVRYTKQLRREATASVGRNGFPGRSSLGMAEMPGMPLVMPNRRVLRYGTHGVHEYRGKFFPQLAKALLNIAGVEYQDLVLDPMCGSGTALVEAVLLGCRAVGVDMNPLSVLMSRTKCEVLAVPPDVLLDSYNQLRAQLVDWQSLPHDLSWLERLPAQDQTYLHSWFSSRTLSDLDPIAIAVDAVQHPICRDLFRLCLSNIIRSVSWQKADDLRVRRQMRPDSEIDTLGEFMKTLDRTTQTILTFLTAEQSAPTGSAMVVEGDARALANTEGWVSDLLGAVSVVVTSPPYATALPYLDTDRLSLIYLGLLPRSNHRSRDYEMIGNREITGRQRQVFWSEYEAARQDLPDQVLRVIDMIHSLNEAHSVGFRRRNLSALLSHYFLDMRDVMRGMRMLLKPGGHCFLVIGNNHTVAGGQRVDIETDRLLAVIAESEGFELDLALPMEMLASRDIFRRNAVSSETILSLRKPGGRIRRS